MVKRMGEQAESGVEDMDEVVQRYLQDTTSAANSGPGFDAIPEQDVSQEDGFEIDPRIVERVLAKLGSTLDQKLTAMRQDLQVYADRTAQSHSDKTASRLTQRQQEQMASVEQVLAPLREQLGPDYEDTVRQAKLNIVLSGDAQDGGQMAPGQPASAASRSAVGESTDQFAGVYLSAKLGDPSKWSEEDVATLHADLAQASDWTAWMAVVDRYAERRPDRTALGRGPQEQVTGGSVARVQPVGAVAGKRPAPSLDQLNLAYNRAVAEGDLDAVTKIGAQIDAALNKR